jgi:hypothetical protein
MFIKTESGIILNWDVISKITMESHGTRGQVGIQGPVGTRGQVPPTPLPNCKVVAYLAHSNSPVIISYCDRRTAREIMDAIEEALINSRTHPDLGSIFAKRQLARQIAKEITDNQ